MKEIKVTGQKRTDLGKKASKLVRKEGLVPCNLYGEARKDGKPVALSFTASMAELRKLVYTPHIYVVELVIDGESHTAVLKELQFHPVTDALLHVDFYEINVKAPYQQIPEHLDINVTDLRLGKSIKVGELSFEGLELITPKEVVVCSIKATRNSIQAAAAAEEEPAAAAE